MWGAYYIPSVLIIFLWGLWFLHVPGGPKRHMGLKIKHILVVFALSLIPIVNLLGVIFTIAVLISAINDDGWDKTFPGGKGKKIDKFFNYEFLKPKTK